MATGKRTNDLNPVDAVDELIGNRAGTAVRITSQALVALISARIGPSYASLSILQADRGWYDGAVATIFGDVGNNNGVYQKSGSVGAGSWTRIGDLPLNSLSEASLARKADQADLEAERQERIAAIDAITEGAYFAGNFDAFSGAFPSVRAQGGNIQNGDYFEVPEGGGGTVDGTTFTAGERIRALVANPSSTVLAGNWQISPSLSQLGPIAERISTLELFANSERNEATALAGSQSAAGTVFYMSGHPYKSNPNTPLNLSVTGDLGVAGVDAFGGVLHLEQCGIKADAVITAEGGYASGTEESAALQRVFDIAAAQNLEVKGEPNTAIYITSNVTAWGVRLISLDGVNIVSNTNAQLTFGGFSSGGGFPLWRIGNVTNGENLFSAPVPAIAPLRIFGAKRGELRVGNTNCLELYADNRVPGGNSTAYLKIFGNGIRRCDRLIDAEGSTFSWITANQFLTGDVIEIQIIGYSYPHNDNLWEDATLEGSSVRMFFKYAQNNRILRARLESVTGAAEFTDRSFGNVIEGDSTSTGAVRGLYVNPLTIQEDETSRGNMLTMEAVSRSQKTVVFNLSSSSVIVSNNNGSGSNEAATGKTNHPFQKPTLTPDIYGFSTTSFDTVALSEMIPVKPGDAFGFDLSADESGGNFCRTYVYCYDADMRPLTDEGSGGLFVNMPGLALGVNDGRGAYSQGVNSATAAISTQIGSVERAEVAFIQMAVVSYGAGFWFHCTGFVFGQQLDWERQAESAPKQRIPVLNGAPTKGYAHEGFQVLDPTNDATHYVAYAYESITNGARGTNSATVAVYDAEAVAVGDVVGIALDNRRTHWTTVSGVSGATITLADNTPRPIPANSRIVFNRWATIQDASM